MRHVCKRYLGVCTAAALCGAAQGQVSYSVQFLPGLVPAESPSVTVITHNGVAAGSAWDGNETRPVRWVGGVPQPMTVGPQQAVYYWVNGHSGDTLAGHMRINDHDYAFRWDPAQGLQSIMTPAGGGNDSYAYGINSAGAVAGSIALRAVFWTPKAGATVIQFPNTPTSPDYGGATAINESGVVVGYAGHAAGPIPVDGLQAFRWTEASGIERLEINFGGSYAFAMDVNAAGDIVGEGATVDFPEIGPSKAFLWRSGVVTVLGELNDPVNNGAIAVNDAGEVLGYDGWPVGIGPIEVDPWVWIEGTKTFLDPVTNLPAGWTIEWVYDMNNDGTVVATLFNASLFERRAALLVRDTGCYPDCNGVGGLTVADFGCFQTKFVAGDPYADCNGVGGLTIADFACFQTRFVEGCP